MYQDTLVAEVIVLSKNKPILRTLRKDIVPLTPTQLSLFHEQTQRPQTIMPVTSISRNETRLPVDTPFISTALAMTSSNNYSRLFSQQIGGNTPIRATVFSRVNSRLTSITPEKVGRPAFTTPIVKEPVQPAELRLKPVLLNEPTQDARFIRKVEPLYPESAKRSHKQGIVLLEATIGVDGKARNIRVIEVTEVSGLGCEQAAITALKASEFIPAMQGKVAVTQRLRIPYRFSLKN